MKICVGSGRGFRGNEEPGVFYLGGRRLPVHAIVERWSDALHAYFKVQVEDGRRFVIRYEPATRCWELVSVARSTLARPALQRW
jgi:hypothetical protein